MIQNNWLFLGVLRSISWGPKGPAMSLLGNFVCSILALAKLKHPTVLVLVIAAVKAYSYRTHPNLLGYWSVFFKINRQPVIETQCLSVFSYFSKTRKSMKISKAASKKEHFS